MLDEARELLRWCDDETKTLLFSAAIPITIFGEEQIIRGCEIFGGKPATFENTWQRLKESPDIGWRYATGSEWFTVWFVDSRLRIGLSKALLETYAPEQIERYRLSIIEYVIRLLDEEVAKLHESAKKWKNDNFKRRILSYPRNVFIDECRWETAVQLLLTPSRSAQGIARVLDLWNKVEVSGPRSRKDITNALGALREEIELFLGSFPDKLKPLLTS